MTNESTHERLASLDLLAMAAAWQEQNTSAEWMARENKRIMRKLPEAKLRMSTACFEGIDYPPTRRLDKAMMRQLGTYHCYSCDLQEILKDRRGNRSTIITSQLPPETRHDHIGNPTLANAICNRVLSNVLRIVVEVPRGEGRPRPPRLVRDNTNVASLRPGAPTMPDLDVYGGRNAHFRGACAPTIARCTISAATRPFR